ncbi:MAG: RDD family protein [Tumebacillaceae bacterium]
MSITNELEYEKASFLSRAIAYGIDLLIYGALLSVASYFLANALGIDLSWAAFKDHDTRNALRPLSYLDTLISVGYFVYLPMQTNGQTLGKKWIGLRVVSLDGQPLNTRMLFIRENIGKMLSTVLVLSGFLMALGSEQRALHDRLAKTLVIRDRN